MSQQHPTAPAPDTSEVDNDTGRVRRLSYAMHLRLQEGRGLPPELLASMALGRERRRSLGRNRRISTMAVPRSGVQDSPGSSAGLRRRHSGAADDAAPRNGFSVFGGWLRRGRRPSGRSGASDSGSSVRWGGGAGSQASEAELSDGTRCVLCIPGQAAYSVHLFLSEPGSSTGARIFSIFVMLLIVLSSVTFCLETLPEYRIASEEHGEEQPFFYWTEVFSVVIFTIEYVGRLVTVPAVPDERGALEIARYHEYLGRRAEAKERHAKRSKSSEERRRRALAKQHTDQYASMGERAAKRAASHRGRAGQAGEQQQDQKQTAEDQGGAAAAGGGASPNEVKGPGTSSHSVRDQPAGAITVTTTPGEGNSPPRLFGNAPSESGTILTLGDLPTERSAAEAPSASPPRAAERSAGAEGTASARGVPTRLWRSCCRCCGCSGGDPPLRVGTEASEDAFPGGADRLEAERLKLRGDSRRKRGTLTLPKGTDDAPWLPPAKLSGEPWLVDEDGEPIAVVPDPNSCFRATQRATGRIFRFMSGSMNIIDLAAILPFYIELLVAVLSGGATSTSSLTVFRILRLGRVFRVFKLGKYSSGMQLLGQVMVDSADALGLLSFFIMIGVVVFGALIFFAEAGTYDTRTGLYMRRNALGTDIEPTPFKSIIHSFYWVVVTSTTLGYGDQVPTTTAGKLIAVVVMHIGILVLALPITVFGANFAYRYGMQSDQDAEEEQEQEQHERLFADRPDDEMDQRISGGSSDEEGESQPHFVAHSSGDRTSYSVPPDETRSPFSMPHSTGTGSQLPVSVEPRDHGDLATPVAASNVTEASVLTSPDVDSRAPDRLEFKWKARATQSAHNLLAAAAEDGGEAADRTETGQDSNGGRGAVLRPRPARLDSRILEEESSGVHSGSTSSAGPTAHSAVHSPPALMTGPAAGRRPPLQSGEAGVRGAIATMRAEQREMTKVVHALTQRWTQAEAQVGRLLEELREVRLVLRERLPAMPGQAQDQ